jgi:hypothetical protein
MSARLFGPGAGGGGPPRDVSCASGVGALAVGRAAAGRPSRSGGQVEGNDPHARARRADRRGVDARDWIGARRCVRRTMRRRRSAPTPDREKARCRRCPYRELRPRPRTDPAAFRRRFADAGLDAGPELSIAVSWPEGRPNGGPRPWSRRCICTGPWPHSEARLGGHAPPPSREDGRAGAGACHALSAVTRGTNIKGRSDQRAQTTRARQARR